MAGLRPKVLRVGGGGGAAGAAAAPAPTATISNVAPSWLMFLSHMQAEAGDACHGLSLDVEAWLGAEAWFDMRAANLATVGMQRGVAASEVFVLVATDSVWERPYVALEARTAVKHGKPVVVVLS